MYFWKCTLPPDWSFPGWNSIFLQRFEVIDPVSFSSWYIGNLILFIWSAFSLEALGILGNSLSAVFWNLMKICLFQSVMDVFPFFCWALSGPFVCHLIPLSVRKCSWNRWFLATVPPLLFLDPAIQMWNPLSPFSLSFLSSFPAQVFAFYSKVNFLFYFSIPLLIFIFVLFSNIMD